MFLTGQNNCYFDSAVKNTNMPQNKFLRHRLVLTGSILVRTKVHGILEAVGVRLYPNPSITVRVIRCQNSDCLNLHSLKSSEHRQ